MTCILYPSIPVRMFRRPVQDKQTALAEGTAVDVPTGYAVGWNSEVPARGRRVPASAHVGFLCRDVIFPGIGKKGC